jgi:hypothetical protein
MIQLLLGNYYKGTPDAATYLKESMALSAHIPTHKPIFCATAQFMINKPDISAYLSSASMGIVLKYQKQDLAEYHRKNDIVEKMAKLSIVDQFEREPVMKAFDEETQRIKWIDGFLNNLSDHLSAVNVCLSHGKNY